jgi:uncharacterized repeat protein (TIGR01451 family)
MKGNFRPASAYNSENIFQTARIAFMNFTSSQSAGRMIGTMVISLFLRLITGGTAFAAVKTATSSGDWATGTTWGGTAPMASDVCIIPIGIDVTCGENDTCAGITINGTLSNNAGDTLFVSGSVGGTGNITVGTTNKTSGTIVLSAGNWTFSGSFTGSHLTVNVVDMVNDQTISGALSCRAFYVDKGSATLHLQITPTISNNTTINSGNINYNSGTSQSDLGGTYPANLSLSASGTTVTTSSAVTIGGNLIIGDGTMYNVGAKLTVTGITTVGNGMSGTLEISSTTGTKTFGGLVTVNASATWDNPVDEAVIFEGGITNYGSFNGGAANHTFETNNQALTGTFTLEKITVTGVTLTNNNTLTVTTSLGGTGELVNASTGILNINFTGNVGITTLTTSATGNTVNYNAEGNQNVKGSTYSNLILSASGNKKTTGVTVNDTLFIEDSAVAITASPVYGSNAVLEYNGNIEQTTSDIEFPSPISAEVLINNPNGVVLNDDKTINDSLVIINGFLADSGSQITGNAGYGMRLASGTKLIIGSSTIGTDFPENYTSVSLYGTSTVEYASEDSQTIAAENYGNLTISGARTTNNVTFDGSGTIGIAMTFNPSATFTTGSYITTGSTINYNGTVTQNVVPFTYNNLNFNNGVSNAKTLNSTTIVNGSITINSGATVNGGSSTDTVYGDWTNNGTFTASASTIILGGSSASAMTGSTTFNTLIEDKNNSSTTVTLNNNLQAATLNIIQGMMQTGSNAATITGTRTGNGIIIGTVTQTHTFSLGTAYSFEGPNSLITFTSGTTPTSVTMTVVQTSPSSPTMVAVNRSVSVSTTGGSFTATLRLHYLDSEANGLDETGLRLWEYTGSSWVNMGSTSNDTVNDYVELLGLTSLTYPWAIGASPSTKSVLDVNGGIANSGDTMTCTVNIKNPYLSSKSGIVVTDPLSSHFILNPGTISDGGSISGQTLSGKNLVGGTITWPSLTLAGGAITTRTFQFRADSAINVTQTITNTAQINYGGGNSEYVSVPVNLTNLANITMTNSVDDTVPVPGDTLTFTVIVRNSGTSNATSVVMTNASPNNATFTPNSYGIGEGVELDGVPKTNAPDGDEVTVSGSTIMVSIVTVPPGVSHIVKFRAVVN